MLLSCCMMTFALKPFTTFSVLCDEGVISYYTLLPKSKIKIKFKMKIDEM